VRRIFISIAYFAKYNQCSHLITVSELSEEEISKLNLASLLEAKVIEVIIILNHFIFKFKIIYYTKFLLQTVFSRVKAELLKVNLKWRLHSMHTSYVHKCNVKIIITYLINFILWFIKRTYKKNNLLPKENERILFTSTGKSTSYFGYDFRMIVLLYLLISNLNNYIILIFSKSNLFNFIWVAFYFINSLINTNNWGRIIAYSLIVKDNKLVRYNNNLSLKNKDSFKLIRFIEDKVFLPVLDKNLRLDKLNEKTKGVLNINEYGLEYNLNLFKIAFLNTVFKSKFKLYPFIISEFKRPEGSEESQSELIKVSNLRYISNTSPILNSIYVPIIFIYNIRREIKDKNFVFLGKRISKIKIKNKYETVWNIPLKDILIQEVLCLYLETSISCLENEKYNTFISNNIFFINKEKEPRLIHNISTKNRTLSYIKEEFKDCIWIIKGDLNNYLSQFEDYKLMKILEEKIKNRDILNLLLSYLKTEYFKLDFKRKNQEFRINNLFANIIINELDNLVFNLKIEKKNEEELLNNNNHSKNEDNIYLSYLRYEGKFIIGIKGTKEQTEKIRKNILSFLNIKNRKDLKMISQLSFYSERILFLDTLLELNRSNNKNLVNLIAPLKFICRKLKTRQFIRGLELNKFRIQSSFISCPKYSWLYKSHDQIIYSYNCLIIKICSNYLLVQNYNLLVNTLIYYLKGSCAKLLATKFNLKTQSKVYKKFGYDLKSPKGLKFFSKSKNKFKKTK
jgi:Type II intron maturase